MVDLYTDRAAMFAVTPRAGESAQQRREADRNNGECDCASVRDLEEVRFPLRGGGRLPIKGVLDGPHRALQIAQFAPEKRKRT